MQESRVEAQNIAGRNSNGHTPAKVAMDMHRSKEFLVSGRLLVADAPAQMVRQPRQATGFRVAGRLLNAVNGYPLAELSVQMYVTLPLTSNDTRRSATTTGQECILGTNLTTTDSVG